MRNIKTVSDWTVRVSTALFWMLMFPEFVLAQTEDQTQDIEERTRETELRLFGNCYSTLTPEQREEYSKVNEYQRLSWLKSNCTHPLDAKGGSQNKMVNEENSNTDNHPDLVIIGRFENDSQLETSDIERLRKVVAEAFYEIPSRQVDVVLNDSIDESSCEEPCDAESQALIGTYVVTGNINTFAGAYIVTLEIRHRKDNSLIKAVESKPLDGAAELLAGTRQLANEILTKNLIVEKPEQHEDEAVPPMQSTPQIDTSLPTEVHSLEPRPRLRPRIVAHINFWLGASMVAVGSAFLSQGVMEEDGAILLGLGGVCVIVGLIAAVVYHGRVREWKRRNRIALVAPSISPNHGSLGYSFWF